MWGNVTSTMWSPSGVGSTLVSPQGIWVSDTTFALFWIQADSTSERYLWMQRFVHLDALQMARDGSPIMLGAIPITAPNPGDGGDLYLSMSPDGDVIVSFAEPSVTFG